MIPAESAHGAALTVFRDELTAIGDLAADADIDAVMVEGYGWSADGKQQFDSSGRLSHQSEARRARG